MKAVKKKVFQGESKEMAEPLFLEPVFHEKIWGGTGLKDEFGYQIPSDHTGEASLGNFRPPAWPGNDQERPLQGDEAERALGPAPGTFRQR